MKRFTLFVSILCFQAAQARAAATLDQQYVAPDIGYVLDYPGDYLAQTFTTQHSGRITSFGVQVQVFNIFTAAPPLTDDLYLKLVRTNAAGAPDINQVLAARTINRNNVPLGYSTTGSMIDVDLSGSGVPVTAGDVLAITLASNHVDSNQPYNALQYIWFFGMRDPYPNGGFYMFSPVQCGPEPYLVADHYDLPNTRDFGFRVFIDQVPEPTTIALTAFCLSLLYPVVRRRSSHRRQAP